MMAVPHDEHERTLAFAEIALGQIRALGQTATPRNFEIWYNYATGYNQPLNQSINEVLAEKGALSEADLEQIYDTYIAVSRLGDRMDSVNTRVLDEIKQVISTIDAAAGSATSYSKRLNLATEKLAQANDGEALRSVIEHLVQGAKEMEFNNKKLETRLAASRQEIEQLQQNLEIVRTEALTDPLTTLSNRKYFDAALAKGIADAKEKNEPLSLLMADIDHFKSFNDQFGHLTGDQVLRLVALVGEAERQRPRRRRALWRRGIRRFAAEHRAAIGDHGRRSYPARGHDQGIDAALERRTARPGDDLDRRRGAASGRHGAAPDRACRQMPLRGQTQRPQPRHLRGRSGSRRRDRAAGAGGVTRSDFEYF